MDFLDKAIRFTIPHFSLKYLKDYHLSVTEIKICCSIANAHGIAERFGEAINIMYFLKENFDEHCIDKDLWGRQYPLLIYYLTRYLFLAKRYEEALPLCDIGKKAAATGHTLRMVEVMLNKSYILCALGKKEEGQQLFKNVYHTYLLHDMAGNAEMVKRDAKKYADIDL